MSIRLKDGLCESPNQTYQPSEEKPALIVIGHTCAGKTTFGEYVALKYKLFFVESSSVVQMFKQEYDATLDSFGLAKQLLATRGPDIVARKVLEILTPHLDQGFVIAGLRTREDIEVIKQGIPRATVLYVDTSASLRYQRCLTRKRIDAPQTFTEFQRYDTQQSSLGLLDTAHKIASTIIMNEGTLQDYYQEIDAVMQQKYHCTQISNIYD